MPVTKTPEFRGSILSFHFMPQIKFTVSCGSCVRSVRYHVLSLSVGSLLTTLRSLPLGIINKTSMKLSKKPQRFTKKEYILSDHFKVRSIKTKIRSRRNTLLTSFHTKSVSTNLALMNLTR